MKNLAVSKSRSVLCNGEDSELIFTERRKLLQSVMQELNDVKRRALYVHYVTVRGVTRTSCDPYIGRSRVLSP